jgi:hypothetical protein
MVFDKKVFSNTMRSKIKKIQRSASNTLQLATRKNVIQMSSDVITMENCHYELLTIKIAIAIRSLQSKKFSLRSVRYFRNGESSYSTPLVFEEFQQKFPDFQGTYSGE